MIEEVMLNAYTHRLVRSDKAVMEFGMAPCSPDPRKYTSLHSSGA